LPPKAAAFPLRFLDYLIYEPIRAVLLHGAGVPVLIPSPERYAIHKLLIGSRRKEDSDATAKSSKDRLQARSMIEAMIANRQHADLASAFTENVSGKNLRRTDRCVFGIVVTSTSGATQWTARALGYQDGLGSPWFTLSGYPVYCRGSCSSGGMHTKRTRLRPSSAPALCLPVGYCRCAVCDRQFRLARPAKSIGHGLRLGALGNARRSLAPACSRPRAFSLAASTATISVMKAPNM